uniref:NPYLR3 n=2 Tax=Aedes aegypti TaxID=7159 RepID=U5N1H2_AEDAE|nr:NPYLR3 [Aedes aegypti]
MKSKETASDAIPMIAQMILGSFEAHNGSANVDYSSPVLKPVVARIYPVFILLYFIPAALGIASNVLVVMYISRYKLYREATQAFMVNLAVCHIVQCAFVLPITLMVMLIQNWIFGQFLCFFLPLLQDIPLHVAVISHLLIAWDRKRWLTDPLKARLPAFVCSCASWLAGMVIALPYPIYTTYLDLGKYMPEFEGVGLCALNLIDDMQEYMRGLFLIMYCGPMTLLGYLYIRTSRELRPPDGPLSIMMFEARAEARSKQLRASRHGTRSGSTGGSAGASGADLSAGSRTYDLYDAEVDVSREKRTQRHLGAMASTQILCVCPLMILRLARMALEETYESEAHFDITYLMFVWMAFLPTVIVPWIYANWVLSRPAKERLRGYLRLSSRRNTGTKSEQSLDDNSSPPGVKTPLSTQMSTVSHPTESAPPTLEAPPSVHAPSHPRNKSLPSIDRCKSPAGVSTKTQQSTLESTIAESALSATGVAKSTSTTRPRRQLPPPLRIEHSNFDKTPSALPRNSSGSTVQRSSLKSTSSGSGGRTSERTLPPNPKPKTVEKPPEEEDDYCSSIAGHFSNITSSTDCNINEREVVALELYEPLHAVPRQNVLYKSASPYYQGGNESNDSDSDIYQRRSGRYGSLSKPDSGILKGTPSIISVTESEYSSRKGSLSTLSRDMEIIDRLERERSMDIQEMIQRENYEYYLSRQNSKFKFSTNFDDYFEEEPPTVPAPTGVGPISQKPRPVSPHMVRNAANRRSNSSYASAKRDSGYETSLPPSQPVVGKNGAPPLLYSGPRRSLELERHQHHQQQQRFNRTHSAHSARGSTKSRDRVSFRDNL